MLLSEFQAWFDGFTEDMDGPPNEKQWARVKARVKEITGHAISYPVYIDRYVRPYINQPYWMNTLGGLSGAAFSQNANMGLNQSPNMQNPFNGHAAMNALGRAESALS